MYVQKNPTIVQAWQLGTQSVKEKELIDSGRIKLRADGSYELFSKEATEETGQIAKPGDYFKLSASGEPYPNEKTWFENRHTHIQDDWYEQKSFPIQAWTIDEPINETILYLLDKKLLVINTNDSAHYFSASLWGTIETAARDAIIVIHNVEKKTGNEITGVDFNFVARVDFENTYRVLQNT